MSKLVEVFIIEAGSTLNEKMKMVEISPNGYPSMETVEQIIKKHNAKYVNVKKIYKLTGDETRE